MESQSNGTGSMEGVDGPAPPTVVVTSDAAASSRGGKKPPPSNHTGPGSSHPTSDTASRTTKSKRQESNDFHEQFGF